MRRRPLLAVVLLLTITALAGCGSDDSGGAISGPNVSRANTGSTPSGTDGGIAVLEGASTSPVSTPASGERALLTQVRAARQEGFDRVVFQFEGALPGYSVKYVKKPVHADASGAEIPIDGDHVIEVRMESASGADLAGENVRQTYTGPDRVKGDTAEATEVVKVGDFEGVLTWAIGTHDEVSFKVSKLSSPSRLVIDIRNH